MEEDFTEVLRDLPEMMVFEIITLIEQEMSKIINTIDFMEQKVKYAYIVGVLDHHSPVYVRVDYFNYNGEYPVCYKFRFVDSDTYLDYLNFCKVMEYLGFLKITGTEVVNYWRKRYLKKEKKSVYDKNSPFYMLKKLQ